MKPMNERKMDMNAGKPKSEGFFPEGAMRKELKRPGEIKGFDYPDTEQAIYACQEDHIKKISRNMPPAEFRH